MLRAASGPLVPAEGAAPRLAPGARAPGFLPHFVPVAGLSVSELSPHGAHQATG